MIPSMPRRIHCTASLDGRRRRTGGRVPYMKRIRNFYAA
jgi:hypothetical protein